MTVSKKGIIKCNHCKKKIDSLPKAMTVDIIFPFNVDKSSCGKYKRLDFCEDCMNEFMEIVDSYI